MSARKIFREITKIIKKVKPKPKFSKKNIGLGRVKEEKLYKKLGEDKYGDIKITTKGPQTGYRVPLDKKKFTERRPWAQDPDYKASAGERVPSPHMGTRKKKAEGGILRSGQPKLATKGWK